MEYSGSTRSHTFTTKKHSERESLVNCEYLQVVNPPKKTINKNLAPVNKKIIRIGKNIKQPLTTLCKQLQISTSRIYYTKSLGISIEDVKSLFKKWTSKFAIDSILKMIYVDNVKTFYALSKQRMKKMLVWCSKGTIF